MSATIHGSPTDGFRLDVELTSDSESPLISTGVASLDETGLPQDLTASFNSLFDLNTSLPTITVMSDLDGVPEPATWAMMLLGFAGLAFAGCGARGFRRA